MKHGLHSCDIQGRKKRIREKELLRKKREFKKRVQESTKSDSREARKTDEGNESSVKS